MAASRPSRTVWQRFGKCFGTIVEHFRRRRGTLQGRPNQLFLNCFRTFPEVPRISENHFFVTLQGSLEICFVAGEEHHKQGPGRGGGDAGTRGAGAETEGLMMFLACYKADFQGSLKSYKKVDFLIFLGPPGRSEKSSEKVDLADLGGCQAASKNVLK